MIIHFLKAKHKKLVNDHDALRKKFDRKGLSNAVEIIDTIRALEAADNLHDVPHFYRPHPLRGKYKGCFAVDATDTHRVIFKPDHDGDSNFRIDTHKTITSIIIIEIFIDYHE